MKPPPATAHVNRLIALSLLLLLFSGSLGLGAVWVRQEISQTANRSRALVVQLADVERRLDDVNGKIAAAASPFSASDRRHSAIASSPPVAITAERTAGICHPVKPT